MDGEKKNKLKVLNTDDRRFSQPCFFHFIFPNSKELLQGKETVVLTSNVCDEIAAKSTQGGRFLSQDWKGRGETPLCECVYVYEYVYVYVYE